MDKIFEVLRFIAEISSNLIAGVILGFFSMFRHLEVVVGEKSRATTDVVGITKREGDDKMEKSSLPIPTFVILLLMLPLSATTYISDCDMGSCGAPGCQINMNGETYELTNDLTSTSTCIRILANDTTLDCKGYSITGNNSTGTFGIQSSQQNTTIRNCNVQNFTHGIYLNYSVRSLVENTNSSTTAAGGRAIYLFYSQNSTVLNSNGTSKLSTGIEFGGTSNSSIINSSGQCPLATGLGIYLSSAHDNTIINSFGYSYGYSGIMLYISHRNRIINSTGNSTNNAGITISNGAAHNVFNGTIAASVTNRGIYIPEGNNNTIDCQGRAITGGGSSYGIHLYSAASGNTTIINCNISNFQYGIYAHSGTSGNRVENTNASGTIGIFLYTSTKDNQITNTIGSGTSFGIAVGTSARNLIANSTGYGGSSYGISFYDVSHSTIINSTGLSNTGSGARVHSSTPYVSSNNTISNATLFSNSSSAISLLNSNSTNIASSNLITEASDVEAVRIENSIGNIISGCQISGKSNSGAVQFRQNSSYNTIANSTINAKDGTLGLALFSGSNTFNTFINNTIENATTLLYLDNNASGNLFYWNNFTSTSGLYVNDLNGNNYWNSSVGGNVWHNVVNQSVPINSTPPALANWSANSFIGNYPPELLPYNSTTSLGKVVGVADHMPIVFVSMPAFLSCPYSVFMSASGTAVWRYMNDVWIADFVNITAIPSGAFQRISCTMHRLDGTIFHVQNSSVLTSVVNHTGLYLGNSSNGNYSSLTTYMNCTCHGLGGMENYTDTRLITLNVMPADTTEEDNMVIATIIGLAMIALLFSYLHTQSKSWIWSQLWFFFACLMVVGTLMAIVSFATVEGNTQISNVGMALFVGFVWVFIISVYVFLWSMIKQLIDTMRDFINGKKTR